MTAEYALLANKYIAVHFIYSFLPHMISYAKFILMAVSVECKSVIFGFLFHGGSAGQRQ